MNKFENIAELLKSIENLEKSQLYDVTKFTKSLAHLAGQLEYFYCHLVTEHGMSPDETFYHVKRRPHVHQLAYFNIGRGYPKEVMDGHWCYILSDLGAKMIVIPCTSIKQDSEDPDLYYQKDIIVRGHDCITLSRMQLSDIRAIDVQRLDNRKTYYDCVTSEDEIRHSVIQLLSIDCSKTNDLSTKEKKKNDK